MLKSMSTKRRVSLLLVGFLLVGTIIFALTYAYYAAFVDDRAETDVNVTGDSLDTLTFIDGDPLSLVMTQQNMAEGSTNISDTATASASLLANETTNSASQTYNVYLKINTNEFVYSTPENTPEIMLEVIDPSGAQITEIDGFTRVTTHGVTGFDITTKTGYIPLKLDEIIESSSSTTPTIEEWQIRLTIINLDTLQNVNAEKTMSAELILQKEYPSLSELCMNQNIASCFVNNSNAEPTLIQHTASIETSAGDNNYRYSGGNDVVQNYVCFGSDEATCPKESLYRILGIYNIEGENLVKIIKAHPIDKNKDGVYNVESGQADVFAFDLSGDNRWEGKNASIASDDADINKYFNGTYLNEIPIKYQEMIEPVKFKIGSLPWDTTYKPKNFYIDEQAAETIQEYKIGLMNVSDYLYGASESNWKLLNYENSSSTNDYYENEEMKANNWMYLKEYESQEYIECTIEPYSSHANNAWSVNFSGYARNNSAFIGYSGRPVLYLKSNVVLTGGVGTEGEPFRITM